MTLHPASSIPFETRTITGWGRTSPVVARVLRPYNVEPLQDFIREAPPQSLIPRGLGRSYGDASQRRDAAVVDLSAFNRIMLHPDNATVTAGSGVSLQEVLRVIVPSGFFLPFIPGTRNVTVGGAIATDVHGKNHHVNGSFGNQGLLRKPNRLQRNLSQRSRGVKLATNRAIVGCCNC